jgi:hypothetical protein
MFETPEQFWTDLRTVVVAGYTGPAMTGFLIGQLSESPPHVIFRNISDPRRRALLQRAIRLASAPNYWDSSHVATPGDLMDELDRLLPFLWDQMTISVLMRGRGGLHEHWKRIPGKARFAGRGGLQETWGKSQFLRGVFHGSGNLSIARLRGYEALMANFNGHLAVILNTKNRGYLIQLLNGRGVERVDTKQQMMTREVASGSSTELAYASTIALIPAAMNGVGGGTLNSKLYVPFGSASFAAVGSLVVDSSKFKKTSTKLAGSSTLRLNAIKI